MREIELLSELLAKALPHLRKRALFNPEPDLVKTVAEIQAYLELRSGAGH